MRAVVRLLARERLGGATNEGAHAVTVEALPEKEQLLRVGAQDYYVTGVVWDLLRSGTSSAALEPTIYAERQVR